MHNNDKISLEVENLNPDLIRVTESIQSTLYTSYIRLREQKVRDALVKAGWTPPDRPVRVPAGSEFILGDKVFRWTAEGRMERMKAG